MASTYTAILVYLFVFIISLKYAKKYSLAIFYLLAIHPQVIIQTRSVWNPTFTLPFVLIAIYSFYLLNQKYSLKKLLIFSASISLSISFSYSIAPLLFAFVIYWLIFNRQNFIKYFLSISGTLILFNLPTLFFELRHQFLLTTSLLTKAAPVQERLMPLDKLNALSTYIFTSGNITLNIVLYLTFLTLSLYLIFKFKRDQSSLIHVASFLYITLNILIFVLPFTIQAHYIFAFVGLIFVIISTLPSIPKYLFLILFSLIYLNQFQFNIYLKAAPRTYSQINSCINTYCRQNQSPTFVTVNSSYHPWHYGPEFRYLMKANSCNVKDIETDNGQATNMAVVLDNSSFDSKTSFYELDLFGKYETTNTFDCLPNFKIQTIQLSRK